MKRTYYLAALALGIALIILSVTPSSVQAAGLSETQIQAIVTLVKTFGVDVNIITNVENALRGVQGDAHPEEKKPDYDLWNIVKPVGNETVWRHVICKRIVANDVFGERGDFVRELQEFLAKWGLFNEDATGFFGPITREALGRFQVEHGLVGAGDIAAGWGMFGPKTREQVKKWCGWGGDGERFKASSERGSAPLTVTFSTWISGFRAQTIKYFVDYGDGVTERAADCLAPADACIEPGKNTHTYTADGIYIATLIKESNPCGDTVGCMAPVSREVVAKQQIHVGAVTCTKEYKPVCGAKQVQCITTPCNPIPTTYSNECTMKTDGATFLSEGQCKTDTKPFEPDAKCKAWYDGCNSCSRETPTGPAMCTLRACMQDSVQKGYCTAWFETAADKPPVITGISGPTVLEVNEEGTWEISAGDPENGPLTYQIIWGDERLFERVLSAALSVASGFQQSASFTHSYSQAGIYTIIVVVQDDKGNYGKTAMSVKVGNVEQAAACTLEYKPVCGQPPEPFCRKYPPFCALATPGPQTYSNACFMKIAGATLLYEGACKKEGEGTVCTADAKLCANGTWVGRTGPNCEFVCPSSTTNQEG